MHMRMLMRVGVRVALRAALAVAGAPALLQGCAHVPAAATATAGNAQLREQVLATERAFARTMADRDLAAFTGFLSSEAVFFSGAHALRGSEAIVGGWRSLYQGAAAPFSWKPETVEVLDSGTLAYSTGPVFDPQGRHVADFHSIWRLEPPGTWRIVFDFGSDVCDCVKTP